MYRFPSGRSGTCHTSGSFGSSPTGFCLALRTRTRDGIGISYDDRDTVFSLFYERERDKEDSTANDWSIGARLMFRTLGDIRVGDTTLTGFE